MKHDKQLHERRDFKNFRELIEFAGETYAENRAFSFKENPHRGDITVKTFAQLRDDVRALASEMLAMGCAGKKCLLLSLFS